MKNSKVTRNVKNFQSKTFRVIYIVMVSLVLCSHDLYIKMETYFLNPNQEATLSLYNGTFDKSENIITRDRMIDASVVNQGKRVAITPEQWKDKDSTITQLPFKSGNAGTYLVGVSTKPRNIALTAEKFNNYLKHDGVLDMLAYRTKNNLMGQSTLEEYQKHIKAIYQVGETRTDDWKTVLGYPIEFVPQANPYEKYSGDTLDVQLLLDGKPLSNQLVYADYVKNGKTHSHGNYTHTHDENSTNDHTHTNGQKLRTNTNGIVTVDLPEDGIYYLRTIHMVNVNDDTDLTHKSKWSTLTFEVTHKHHDGISTWGFVLVSIVVIGLLFLGFRKKS